MAFNFMKKFSGSDSKSNTSDDMLNDKVKSNKGKKKKGINTSPSNKFMLNKKLMTQ